MSNQNSLSSQSLFTGNQGVHTPNQSAGQSSIHVVNGQKKVAVDVGGQGDCGFRAVAAGLLDHVLGSDRSHDAVLKNVMERYFQYYPQFKPEGRYLTAKDRLESLSRNVHMPELITTLAYVLRQMAVDTLVENPSMYRGAFVHENEKTSPEEMRKPTTWIDETALAALANVLDIRISVSVVAPMRELPLHLNYNASETLKTEKPVVSVVLKDKHYVPKVKNPARFQALTQRKARAIEPVEVQHLEPSMEDILKRIQHEDQQMLNHFILTKKRIQSAVEAGELSRDELFDYYIAGMESSDYLQGRVKQIGLDLGSQAFFNELMARNGQFSALHTQPAQMATHEDRITQELIHALARAVSIGQMSEESLFTSVEEHRNAFK